jgi:hypothetical protein
MKRLCVVALLLAAAAPARAHFVWIVPGDPAGGKATARVVFSDAPRPDSPELLKKIAGAEFFARGADGKTVPLKAAEGKDALELALPTAGPQAIGAVCHYGVVKRGQDEPFLLHYYAKTAIAPADRIAVHELYARPWDRLPLEVVAADGPAVRVLWQGKPLPGAEVVLLLPGQEKPVEGKSDADGVFRLPDAPPPDGVVGIRARHVEEKEGEHDGKTYKSVRHYATLTVPLGSRHAGRDEPATGAAPGKGERPKAAGPADPEATKLLADARAARAAWENFPGFSADVEVNVDGKVSKGTVAVDAKGKVALQVDDPAAAAWARRVLASVVSHRLAGPEENTPCAFADDNATHPLGRAVRVVGDEFDSSYRVRDRQILVVNRTMKDTRFTITVLENRANAEGKFLPAHYVVNYWDAKGGLSRSEAHRQTWQRFGRFDLPREAFVLATEAGKQDARCLTLSNLRLPEAER